MMEKIVFLPPTLLYENVCIFSFLNECSFLNVLKLSFSLYSDSKASLSGLQLRVEYRHFTKCFTNLMRAKTLK